MEFIGTHEDFDDVFLLGREAGWVDITRTEQLSDLLCVFPYGYLSFGLSIKITLELSSYHPDGLVLPVVFSMRMRDDVERFRISQTSGGPLLHSAARSVKVRSGQKQVGMLHFWACGFYLHPTTRESIDQSRFRERLKSLVSAWKKASKPVNIEGTSYRVLRSSPILQNVSEWHAPQREGGKPLGLYL